MKNTYIGNAFALLLVIIMMLYKVLLGPLLSTLPINTYVLSIFAEVFIYSLPLVVYFYITKVSVKDTLSLNPISIKNVINVVAISIFMQPLLMLISALTTFLFPNTTTTALAEYSTQPFWMLALSVAIMPAIFEELLFRGLVFSNYRNVSFAKASVAVGFIFAMAHLDGQQFFYAFFMGIIFCYFVYKTGSIFASILSHFAINFTQSSFAYYVYSTQIVQSTEATQTTIAGLYPIFSLVLLTLPGVVALFYLFNRANRKTDKIENEQVLDYAKTKHNDTVFNAPLIIFISIFIYFVATPLL